MTTVMSMATNTETKCNTANLGLQVNREEVSCRKEDPVLTLCRTTPFVKVVKSEAANIVACQSNQGDSPLLPQVLIREALALELQA